MPVAGKDKQRPQLPRTKSMPSFEQGPDGELVERTKGGAISRMRSHNGNKPLIPQIFFCSHPDCPSKFTRATHLQRHMRTHSEQRQYKCERCAGEFTRSDLLSRHKRACGDPNNAHKSRRRSCRGCVEGKAKCDLQQPCSRCQGKQWHCIYDQRESQSPLSPSASRFVKTRSSMSPPLAGPSQPTPYVLPANSRYMYQLSDDPDLHPLQLIEDRPGNTPALNYQAYRSYTEAPTSTYAESSRVESSYAESSYVEPSSMPAAQSTSTALGSRVEGAKDVNSVINTILSEDTFQKHYWGVINKMQDGISSSISLPNLPDAPVPWGTASSSFLDVQPFMGAEPSSDNLNVHSLTGMSTLMINPAVPRPTPPAVPPLSFTYPSEFTHYTHLFYNMFLAQMPIVHTPTFTVDNKPPILISAMQACGALYSRTPAASTFIDGTLASARDELAAEFEQNTEDYHTQGHLILAVVLLQTIGLFHQIPAQRTQSTQYHNMLVTMIRRSGLVRRLTNWRPPTYEELVLGERVWYEWSFHETTKRALLLSYLHDTCHCIYFTLQPIYGADEMTVPLPCENGLWQATNFNQWKDLLSKESPYGPMQTRLRPLGLHTALSMLADLQIPDDAPPLIVTPFAHFVLSHAILRKMYTECVGRKSDEREGTEVVAYVIQVMLHRWLSSWYASPDRPGGDDELDPIFLHDALPFYWMAQVLLLAQKENLLPFGGNEGTQQDKSGEAKYALVKEWLRLIRELLRQGKQGHTLFWDELTKIRMSEEAGRRRAPSPNGLRGFFAERD
ncbi:fungal-specific transcription factor domain-containing protein [Cytidiella melzeri]|nr:fungal-specific transcription factor domain-containing protein [Cytidiella melzeri]